MTITVFGFQCREKKDGIFVRCKNKSKESLWRLIKKYVYPKTKVICTGGAWYTGLPKMFPGVEHKVQPHNQGVYVAQDDFENHIMCFENGNRLMK